MTPNDFKLLVTCATIIIAFGFIASEVVGKSTGMFENMIIAFVK